MPDFAIRWSELEARKPYASPFGVTFLDDSGASCGSLAVNGPDLVYYRQFQQAVLRLGGELFRHAAVEADADPQRRWLDLLTGRLPAAVVRAVTPGSVFDERARDRRFRFTVRLDPPHEVLVDAGVLADYQELQAMLAHHSGRLLRDVDVEAVEGVEERRTAWIAALERVLGRPSADDAMSAAWPWR